MFWMGGAYPRAGAGHVTFRARCHVSGWWGCLQLPVWELSEVTPWTLNYCLLTILVVELRLRFSAACARTGEPLRGEGFLPQRPGRQLRCGSG